MKTKKMNILFKMMMLVFTISLVSCVGTIADKNSQSSFNMKGDEAAEVEKFSGLLSVTPVAHDKIELVFEPVDLEPAKVSYQIYINNSEYPFVLSGTSLENSKTVEGNYLYTMIGLNLNTSYEFNIKAILVGESKTSSRLDPNKALTTRTFSNETANFMGASSVELGIGNRSQDTVTVKWIPAEIKGTSLNIKANDPIAYEVIYWANGLNKVSKQFPNSIVNPTLNKASYEIITDLAPATTYFFQVRAIHKNYASQILNDASYKREANNRVVRVTTANEVNQDLAFINLNELVVSNPIEKRGREEVDLSWYAAWGNEGLYYYKIVYKKVNAAIFEHLQDQIGTFEDVQNDTDLTIVDMTSSDLRNTISGLTPKDWYQFKVFVCKSFTNPATDEECPIYTPYKSTQIKPVLSPFTGILTISNPSSLSNLKQLTLNFDAPMVDSGFLDQMIITCYNPTDYTKKIQLPLNGTATAAATGVTNCNSIRYLNAVTPMPSTTNGFSTLKQLAVEVDQNAMTTGNKTYCFSITPAITYTDLDPVLAMDVMSDPVVKCFTPKISPPTMAEFPGREDACTISGSSISVSWGAPTGGVYSNFVVFYKEKLNANDYFSFPDATAEYFANTQSQYNYATVTNSTFTYKINNLSEGKDYFVGVLALLSTTSPVVKEFSKFNTKTGECKLPTPKPIFSEWVDLLALGPKVDGLAEGLELGDETLEVKLYETFDNDNSPIEVLNTNPTFQLSQKEFSNGVARQDKDNPSLYYRASNEGMVRLVWKDISLTNGEYLSDFIRRDETDSGTNGTKPRANRLYGYKVYRSEDNRQSWVDLTTTGPIYPINIYQNTNVPTSYTKSGGVQTSVVSTIVNFDDYSVSNIKNTTLADDVEKARVYWYKVIPYFLGKEQDYGDTTNPDHHVIRVTLPPRNMALVHRQIANRASCLEMQKSINKRAGAHYSCSYNGIGASGLEMPWQKGNTVYDLGGDLLVDRFELGCAFTRGNKDGTSHRDNTFDAKKTTDLGNFQGCINTNGNLYEPFSTVAVPWGDQAKRVVPGDCFNRDRDVFSYIETNDPASCPVDPESSTDIAFYGRYRYPGARQDASNPSGSFRNLVSCNEKFNDLFPIFPSTFFTKVTHNNFPTQGEYGAIYHSRRQYDDSWDFSRTLTYLGAIQPGEKEGATDVSKKLIGISASNTQSGSRRGSACSVNLSYTNESGEYIPRWIPINNLISGIRSLSYDSDSNLLASRTKVLYDKKFSELMSDTDLYGSMEVSFPGGSGARSITNNFLKDKSILRVAVSNNSKLPPLEGMSQIDMAKACGEFKVQVGIKKTTGSFVPTSNVLSKRLFRKKEFSIAAAWPENYNEGTITALESGSSSNEGSCNNINKITSANSSSFLDRTFGAGSTYRPFYPHHSTDVNFNGLLMTGSAKLDATSTLDHSEKCVSRFGIQDLVGNVSELSSEEIFCDFRAETTAKMWVGDYRSGVEAAGIDKTKSLPYIPGYWYNSTKTGGGLLSTGAVRVMVEENIDNNTGACSTVDRTLPAISYLNGVNIIPIKKQDGTWNYDIIANTKSQDQAGIDSLRNGDGSFLTFGKDKLVAALDKSNKIKVSDYSYFNTVLGLPVLCGSGANCSINTDNQFGKTNVVLGNSGYDNMGVAEKYDYQYPESIKGRNIFREFINQSLINKNLIETVLPPLGQALYPVTNMGDVHPSEEPDFISYSDWSISRNSTTNTGDIIRFSNGGSVKNSATGRFTASIRGLSQEEERFINHTTAGRCVVMINDN